MTKQLFPGLLVQDITAMQNGWVDQEGTIIEVDGSNVKVCYLSGNVRWKAAWNLDVSSSNSVDDIAKFMGVDEHRARWLSKLLEC